MVPLICQQKPTQIIYPDTECVYIAGAFNFLKLKPVPLSISRLARTSEHTTHWGCSSASVPAAENPNWR